MIKVYYLSVTIEDNTEVIAGHEYIHDARLETTELPNVRKLTMNCTPEENTALSALSIETRDPTDEELTLYLDHLQPLILDPDTIRAQELLANPPSIITQPEMWELMRIFGRILGIPP